MTFPSRRSVTFTGSVFALITLAALTAVGADAKWWKGNLHTHTLWSDGDDYPEMVVGWYQEHGYDFLSITPEPSENPNNGIDSLAPARSALRAWPAARMLANASTLAGVTAR